MYLYDSLSHSASDNFHQLFEIVSYFRRFCFIRYSLWLCFATVCVNSFISACGYINYKDKDKDSVIGQQEFVVGYSKAPEQLQSSARPICYSHTRTSMGREPTTIRIATYRSSLHYSLRHGFY